MIRVYQIQSHELFRDAQFCDDLPSFVRSNMGDYRLVATVETDDKDVAYERTNTIERPWYENMRGISVLMATRSTSVGDLMETKEGSFVVAGCGFQKVTF